MKNKPNLNANEKWKNVSFGKKKSRQSIYKKNIGSVAEGQGYADKRKIAIVRQYKKFLLKNNSNGVNQQQIDAIRGFENSTSAAGRRQPLNFAAKCKLEDASSPNLIPLPEIAPWMGNSDNRETSLKLPYMFKKAALEYKELIEARERELQGIAKQKETRAAAMKEYMRKKAERGKKLNSYTKKGQPIMSDRMDLLLEKLQSQLLSERNSADAANVAMDTS